jgi:hypothetical protein
MPTGKGALGYTCGAQRGLHQPHGRPVILRREHVVFVCARGRQARCVVRFLPAVWRGGLRPALEAVLVQPPHRAMAPVSPGRRHDWHVLHYDIGCARDARTRQGAHWWRVLFLDVFPRSLIKHWHLPASRLIHRFPVLYNYARNLGPWVGTVLLYITQESDF